jgi:acyl carrier protein
MGARTQNKGDSQADEYKGILPGEAVKAFARVLDYVSNSQLCQILISPHDLQTQRQHSLQRREQWLKAQNTDAIALPPISESDNVPAHQRLEQQLMLIYRRALGIQHIELDDNFFDIGGDSLASVRMVALARSFGIRMTQTQILENPTIAELMIAIESQK